MPRCKICKDKFIPKWSSFEKTCLNPACILEHGRNTTAKEWNKTKKQLKTKKKAIHTDVYLKDNKATLQTEINHIARLIDKGCRCIDCERTIAKPCWDGGHRNSRGSSPNIRFHLDNIFKQTRYCNSKSEGDKQAYNEGIKEMYGEVYYNFVDSLNLTYPVLKLHHSEYPSIIKEARAIVRELKKLDMSYTPKQRIRLRKSYNKRLAIYK